MYLDSDVEIHTYRQPNDRPIAIDSATMFWVSIHCPAVICFELPLGCCDLALSVFGCRICFWLSDLFFGLALCSDLPYSTFWLVGSCLVCVMVVAICPDLFCSICCCELF